MNIEISGLSNQGSRAHNEDSLFLPPKENVALMQTKGYLFIVADGVGGHQSGEVASKMAVDIISQSYYKDPNPDVRSSLQAAIEKANQLIFQEAKRNNEERPRTMATTIAIAVLKGSELTVANVGDSRVYLVYNGQTEQLTHDHSWVGEQMRAGILTAEQAKNHIQKNVVTRSLGHKLEVQIDIHPTRPIGPGHTVVLCSDGLPAVVEDADIAQFVSQNRAPQDIAQKLVQLTLQRGAPDNVTVIVVNFGAPATVATAPTALPLKKSPSKRTTLLPLGLLLGGLATAIVLMIGIILVAMFWFKKSESAPVASAIPKTASITPTNTVIAVQNGAETTPSMPSPTPATPLPPTPIATIPISPPQLIAPANEAILSSGNQADPITLQWSGHSLAANEQFKVFISDAKGKQTELPNQGITQESEFSLPNNLPASDYKWLVFVQKKNDNGQTEDLTRSSTGKFTIKATAQSTNQQTQATPNTSTTEAKTIRSAVILESPMPGQTFTEREAVIDFRWSEVTSPLAADEYYVLIIKHREGKDHTWLKTNTYRLPADKQWLADKGPELSWYVVIAHQRSGGGNEDPQEAESSAYSEERKFTWKVPTSSGNESGGSTKDTDETTGRDGSETR